MLTFTEHRRIIKLRRLKIKIKSLAAESRIIRAEEHKVKNDSARSDLTEHRRSVVRYEARHSLLAYAFLRGKEYNDVESSSSEPPNFTKVFDIVKRFGCDVRLDDFNSWKLRATLLDVA